MACSENRRSLTARAGLSGLCQALAAAVCALSVGPVSAVAAEPVQTFTIREHFGVSHPDQIIDFDLNKKIDPANVYVIGPDGQAATFQLLEQGTKVAVRAVLPTNATRTWKLMGGRPPAVRKEKNLVQAADKQRYYEITNGLTGVRIPVATGDLEKTPAPVQGILYRDGTWSAAGPNFMERSAGKMTVRFLERGPLKVVVQVAYVYDRSEQVHSYKDRATGEDREERHPAGEGFYRSTITVQAGRPSIMFEEDADVRVSYSLDLYRGLQPTHARYRGHHSKSKEHGYEADGRKYRMSHERPPMDAFVDLTYDKPRTYRNIAVWDPWIYNSGRYWQMYDTNAAGNANLVGVFAGRASRALGARNSGVGAFTGPAGRPAGQVPEAEARAAGITITCRPGRMGRGYFPRARYQWGLFAGTKGQDLLPPNEVQPIARQLNLHGGINLNKVHRYQLDFPDPAQGYGAMYMKRDVFDRMVEKLRADEQGKHGKGYYGHLYHADTYARDLVDFWYDTTGEQFRNVIGRVRSEPHKILNSLVHDDGIYTPHCHYWHGGLAMSRQALWIDQVLASDFASREDKAQAKAAAALYGYILWDNDFVPMFEGHALNLGTPNMPVQQAGFRNLYAVLLAGHPAMKSKLDDAVDRTAQILTSDLNEYGSHIGSTHYVAAGMGPTLSMMQQLKMAGIRDFFETMPRVEKFAEFYMHFATPPEVRFGKSRKLVAVGDGSTERSEMFGQMATAFADVNPELSERLMGLWLAQERPHSGFHGTTYLKIDEDLPHRSPDLASANFPGWFSVLRYGWDTPRETGAWLINGNHYWDHSHNDQGAVVIYALGAPLSIDWGPIYYPRVAGAFMHSTALPEGLYQHPWDKDAPSVESGRSWGTYRGTKTVQNAFLAFRDSGFVSVDMTAPKGDFVWKRAVRLIHANREYPLILIEDKYTGPGADGAEVFNLPLMADGAVDTPAGAVTPEERIWGYEKYHGDKQELCSAGEVFDLPAGVNRLRFTGQLWKLHPTVGIDWDLYTIAGEDQQAHIGNWAHAWHPSPEQGEFRTANGRPFEERQHILRIRGSEGFKVLIAPHFRGKGRENAVVRQEGDSIVISAAGQTTEIAPSWHSYQGAGKRVLATLGAEAVERAGIRIEGGPTEVVINAGEAVITAHGIKGLRRLKLPGRWQVEAPLQKRDDMYLLDYAGGEPQTVVLEK